MGMHPLNRNSVAHSREDTRTGRATADVRSAARRHRAVAAFTLAEDDGTTRDYQKGGVRKTIFTWDDSTRTLVWTRSGKYDGKNVFTKLHLIVLDPAGRVEKGAALDPTGSLRLPHP